MKKKLFVKILGGVLGFLVGAILGGYIGLVLGGTFLGGFDIHENTGVEGYEISTYIVALVGAVIATIGGVKLASKIADNAEKKNN